MYADCHKLIPISSSVAEIAEMPLYRVTCGDIGTSADAVEKYLNSVLYLGKCWNCGLCFNAGLFRQQLTPRSPPLR
jgi:hypothetical protein